MEVIGDGVYISWMTRFMFIPWSPLGKLQPPILLPSRHRLSNDIVATSLRLYYNAMCLPGLFYNLNILPTIANILHSNIGKSVQLRYLIRVC